MANLPSVTELKKCVRKILKDADLSKVSSKMIRKQCEEVFQTDLQSQKQEIKDIIMACIEGTDSKENECDSSSNKSGSGSESSESESEEEVQQNEESSSTRKKAEQQNKKPSPKPVKKQKTTPKVKKQNTTPKVKKSTENVESPQSDDDDATIARKLQEEEWNFRRRPVRKVPNKKKKATGEPKSRKGTGMYSQKCLLSADLAAIMDETEMARSDVVKKMWAIAKERDLFDPSNKQFIICDEPLQKIFGRKRVRIFGMMKYLKNHIKIPEP